MAEAAQVAGGIMMLCYVMLCMVDVLVEAVGLCGRAARQVAMRPLHTHLPTVPLCAPPILGV